MNFSDLEKAALQLNELYEQLETRRYGRIWTTGEIALGFVGDVGDLAKLIQAHSTRSPEATLESRGECVLADHSSRKQCAVRLDSGVQPQAAVHGIETVQHFYWATPSP